MFSPYRAPAGSGAKSKKVQLSAGRLSSRLVLWAILGTALLMLATFVVFGALGGGTIKSAAPQAAADFNTPAPYPPAP